MLGAPSLERPDLALWRHGEAEIAAQIASPRHGVMPGWTDRLGDVTVRQAGHLRAFAWRRGSRPYGGVE